MTKIKVISCGVFRPELEQLTAGRQDVELVFLEQGLHVRPENLKKEIQEAIFLAEEGAREIRLAYGLCANGTLGVTCSRSLVQPRCHDCIPILFGSQQHYQEIHDQNHGTLYLSAGWLDSAADPLSIIDKVYSPRLGREKAVWGMKKELENYNRLALIMTGVQGLDMTPYRDRVRENCAFLKKDYVELAGSTAILARLLDGPENEDDFISLAPGQVTDLGDFMEGIDLKRLKR